MENVTRIIPKGFEEALLNASEVPSMNKIPEIVPPSTILVPSTTTDTKDYTLVYVILTTLAISLAVVAFKDYSSRKKKDQEQLV